MRKYNFIIINTIKGSTITYESPVLHDTVSEAQNAGYDFKNHINTIIPSTFHSYHVVEVAHSTTH